MVQRLHLRLLAVALALAGTASLSTTASAAPACAEKPLRFAGVTWESGQFYTAIIRSILESGYGCKSEVITGSTAATETALVNGDIDLWVEQWNRTDIIKKGQESGRIKLIGDLLAGGAEEGFYVPEFVIKGEAARNIKPTAAGLKTVADLPRFAKVFADDEDPDKGRLLSCPVGWDCERINTQKLKAYKLEDSFTNFRAGTGSALDAAISSAMERGKPILFYYWSPASLMGKYKFTRIEEPAFNQKCWDTIRTEKTASPCPSATPNTTLKVGISTALIKSDPQVAALIEKVNLTAAQVNASILKMNEGKLSADVVAKDFMKANPAVWKAWLSPEAATKVASGLN